jgi:dephospho-CoA kinase
MLLVGLTGGIASGKTTVSHILQKEGAHLIDADRIARELVQRHTPAWKELVAVFGQEILESDESIDRKKLAAMVFSDPDQRKRLEGILHPRIGREIARRIQEIRSREPEAIVVVDAALLLESGAYRKMDLVIVVTATEDQRIDRLRGRSGTGPEEARKIIASQAAEAEKLKAADFIIHNEGSLTETVRKTKDLFQELRKIADIRKEANPFYQGV